ncbi:MAG TPA: PadR family transcriptional regulator [Actinophytocola sp.]|uniref:PadR family transcriptional regulator n=1 Tax=Actinophytocola sp. TaxID=1872138 RepID=UPI002DDD7882|nr:PadR family transcriptional regulator [Actinophytocola sp.]HEV2783510.1 PadR family transcriptional regulator [Actinophytocola sp.]
MRPSFGGHEHGIPFGDPRRLRRHAFRPGFEDKIEALQARGGPPFPPPFPPGQPFAPGPGQGFPFPGWSREWGRHGRGHGQGRRGRRGNVRAAILALLAERPMHGYEMIQEITQRSGGLWRPSPGSVYPTLQLLADEGLIVSSEGSGSKRLFELTDDGRAAVERQDQAPPWEQIAEDADPGDLNLRNAAGQLMGAVFQVAQAATPGQKSRAIDVVNQARRELYAILGEVEPPAED